MKSYLVILLFLNLEKNENMFLILFCSFVSFVVLNKLRKLVVFYGSKFVISMFLIGIFRNMFLIGIFRNMFLIGIFRNWNIS